MSNRIREEFIQKKEPVRLNKYLSEAGVCSRREADRLIETGKVSVDGKRAGMGMKIYPGQTVKVGNKTVSRQDEMIVLAVNKPKGHRLHRRKAGTRQHCAFPELSGESDLYRKAGQGFQRSAVDDE